MSVVPNSSRVEDLSAWIFSKQIFPVKSRRYFTLSSQVLSCHGAPGSRAKWEIDLPGTSVCGSRVQLRVTVRSRGTSVKLYFDAEHSYYNWLTALQRSCSRRIDDQYEFGEQIGSGAFGRVVKAIDKCSLDIRAVKIIDKIADDPTDDEYIWRELNCVRSIRHPNVVETYNIFNTRERLYLVLEYMPGRSLSDILTQQGQFSEAQTKSIVKDILQGTAYLHEMSIVHRDLKLANILCTAKQFPFTAKIADFGLANFVSAVSISRAGLQSQVGSPHYIAPEVLREEPYGPLVDSWGIGVMMHLMLIKMYPFAGTTIQDTLEQVVTGRVSFLRPEWTGISREGKTLLRGLLCEDVKERLSAQEALADPWFSTKSDQTRLRRSRGVSSSRCSCTSDRYSLVDEFCVKHSVRRG